MPDSQENYNSRLFSSPAALSHLSHGSQPIENTFDAFLDSYQSDQDEDYSEKEDLIQNKKSYAKDLVKPFEKNIPKAEIEYLLKDQGGKELIINRGPVSMLPSSSRNNSQHESDHVDENQIRDYNHPNIFANDHRSIE